MKYIPKLTQKSLISFFLSSENHYAQTSRRTYLGLEALERYFFVVFFHPKFHRFNWRCKKIINKTIWKLYEKKPLNFKQVITPTQSIREYTKFGSNGGQCCQIWLLWVLQPCGSTWRPTNSKVIAQPGRMHMQINFRTKTIWLIF